MIETLGHSSSVKILETFATGKSGIYFSIYFNKDFIFNSKIMNKLNLLESCIVNVIYFVP